MGKAEGSWSGMRKYLEQEMLAPELKGRVRYNCSTSVAMDDRKFFEIYIDGVCFKRFSWETVNSYFIANGILDKSSPMQQWEYWNGFFYILNDYPLDERTEYTDDEFCDALNEYRNSDIKTSIHSENPIIVMFALLDRRVGMRTLEKLKDEIEGKPEWLGSLYEIRINS